MKSVKLLLLLAIAAFCDITYWTVPWTLSGNPQVPRLDQNLTSAKNKINVVIDSVNVYGDSIASHTTNIQVVEDSIDAHTTNVKKLEDSSSYYLYNAGKTGSGSVVYGTSPTIASPTISGTVAGGATYTAPTLTSPSISGTVSGGGTYSSPILSTPSISGNASITGDLRYRDNDKSIYGTGDDALIYYDGTNLNIDPDNVGSGSVNIGARLGVNDAAPDSSFSVTGSGYISTNLNVAGHIRAGGTPFTFKDTSFTLDCDFGCSETGIGFYAQKLNGIITLTVDSTTYITSGVIRLGEMPNGWKPNKATVLTVGFAEASGTASGGYSYITVLVGFLDDKPTYYPHSSGVGPLSMWTGLASGWSNPDTVRMQEHVIQYRAE